MKNNDVRTFIHEDFGVLRVVMMDGRPWFVASDVMQFLGYRNTSSALLHNVPEAERTSVTLRQAGHSRRMNAISLPGLCCLTANCGRPGAREYARWVKTEILPALPGHGAHEDDGHEEPEAKNPPAEPGHEDAPPAGGAAEKAGPSGKTPAEDSPEDDGDGIFGGLLIIIVEEG